MMNIQWLLFDWGDTLMFDDPEFNGEMYLWPKISLMSGVAETMPALAEKYRCAVVSNASCSNADTMKMAFEHMSLDEYFSLFITSKELGHKKPDERFFIEIAKRLQTPYNELCMIGNDYEKDIVSPNKLGMQTILINPKQGEYPFADFVVTDFSKLFDILL